MQKFEPLDFENIYHIYNKGINGESIFLYDDHYQKFQLLYEKHVDPIVETYAWCLMKNHFHYLVKIRNPDEIVPRLRNAEISKELLNERFLSRKFGNLFNAYAQSFNSSTKRTGGLFQTPFKRISVTDVDYFKALIVYIHNNPVKHGFCSRVQDYPWSSYGSVLSVTPAKLQREKVIGWFEGVNNFVAFHNGIKNPLDISNIVHEWM